MVSAESNIEGDGVERPFIYAKWRMDKEPSPGYSRELVHVKDKPEFYDDFEKQDYKLPVRGTLLNAFKANVEESPNLEFIGARRKTTSEDGTVSFGEYEW